MNLSGPGITYVFLIIPSIFALIVVIQGIEKLTRDDHEGYVALGFGIFFLILIATAYLFFIQ